MNNSSKFDPTRNLFMNRASNSPAWLSNSSKLANVKTLSVHKWIEKELISMGEDPLSSFARYDTIGVQAYYRVLAGIISEIQNQIKEGAMLNADIASLRLINALSFGLHRNLIFPIGSIDQDLGDTDAIAVSQQLTRFFERGGSFILLANHFESIVDTFISEISIYPGFLTKKQLLVNIWHVLEVGNFPVSINSMRHYSSAPIVTTPLGDLLIRQLTL